MLPGAFAACFRALLRQASFNVHGFQVLRRRCRCDLKPPCRFSAMTLLLWELTRAICIGLLAWRTVEASSLRNSAATITHTIAPGIDMAKSFI